MCGIFAHYLYHAPLTQQQILDIILCGLQRLEHRGMDSCGLSMHQSSTSGTHSNRKIMPPLVLRSVGKTADLATKALSSFTKEQLKANVLHHTAMAHTRWATHGPVDEQHAHPVTSDEADTFLVVHNGIIENHKALRAFLQQSGEEFKTDTDTEVLARMCRYYHRKLEQPTTFLKLVMEVLKKVQGAYAVAITSTEYPGEMIACKKGSPLMFAIKKPSQPSNGTAKYLRAHDRCDKSAPSEMLECIISSDSYALSEHSKDAYVLLDGDILSLREGSWTIINEDQEDFADGVVSRALQRLDTCQASLEKIAKEGFEHYMMKEIFEQPESLTMTMQGRVKYRDDGKEAYIVLGGLQPFIPAILQSRRIIFIGAATSYHACLAVRPLVESMSEIPVTLELASDFLDRQGPLFRDDICIFVSQSGETGDVVQALAYARQSGALCLGITNGVGSPVAQGTEAGVYLHAGLELGVASTKTYTSQILAITLVALKLAENSRSKHAGAQAIIASLRCLPDMVSEALKLDVQMQKLAADLKDQRSLLFFGRSSGYATTLEAAHKMKEVAQIHSEGILAGEMKHGPLALVDASIPCIVIATRDRMHSKMLSVIQQLKARQGRLIVLCTKGDTAVHDIMPVTAESTILEVPDVIEPLQPVINIVPLQLLSYHMTVAKGLNVDMPRNLAKAYANVAY